MITLSAILMDTIVMGMAKFSISKKGQSQFMGIVKLENWL